jgi:transcriptional regulator with XRE-family HTH domain
LKQVGLFNVEDYKRRLRLMRAMYGETQADFAKRVGVPFKRWNQYERGYPLPRDTAWLIRQKISTGILEWIWFGDETHLNPVFSNKLRAAEKTEAERLRTEIKDLQYRRQRASKALRKVKKTDRDSGPAK